MRRIETLKDGTDPVGNRTRVKVVRTRSPSFKQAEFDILYGTGISREGGLIDMGVEHGLVRKAGAWYTYEAISSARAGERPGVPAGQPRPDRWAGEAPQEKLGIGARLDAPADETVDLTRDPGTGSAGSVTGADDQRSDPARSDA